MDIRIPFEIKRIKNNEIEGHGSVFGNVDLGGDVVAPGAFKRSLAKHRETGSMPAMLWQHDHSRPIGVWHEASEDGRGLHLKGEFADTVDGRDARTLAKMQAVKGLSIGFQLVDFEFDDDGVRIIKEADLWETSIVTFPMNPQATISSVKAQFQTPRSLEKHLRDAGCTRRAAREVIHELYTGSFTVTNKDSHTTIVSSQCDAEDEELKNAIRALNDNLVAATMRNYSKS